MLLILGRSTTD